MNFRVSQRDVDVIGIEIDNKPGGPVPVIMSTGLAGRGGIIAHSVPLTPEGGSSMGLLYLTFSECGEMAFAPLPNYSQSPLEFATVVSRLTCLRQ